MKIAIVGPAYPLRGGIAQYLAILYEKLSAAGHDVRFVSFIKQFPEWFFPGKTQLESSRDVIDVRPIPRFAPLGVRSWGRTAREIIAFDPDLVLFKWWMPFFGLGYWAVQKKVRAKTRARVVYIVDNAIPHERRVGDRFLTKLAFSQVDGFIAQSRVVEQDIITWFPRLPTARVAFSPHPSYDCYPSIAESPAEARRRLNLPPDGKLLLFFGFVRQYKGLDILLEAIPQIRRTSGDVKLVVCGEFYEPKADFEKKIRDLGIENFVILRDDYVPNEQVGAYFACADCVVLPYRSATQSGIIQVAYAQGTPVITTSVGGLAEVVEDGVTGFVVPPEDPSAIAAGVEKFFLAGGRVAFEPRVREASRRFTWESLIETILKFSR